MTFDSSTTAIRTRKAALRQTLRQALHDLPREARAAGSSAICQQVFRRPEFREARCRALFAPLPGEPEIGPLLEATWREARRLVLPLIVPASAPQIEWRQVGGWDDLRPRAGGHLLEPDPASCAWIDPGAIDFILVPGLAFDRSGGRLGRGGGFYDSALERLAPGTPVFGAMFSCQEVAQVPWEPHDRRLDCVVSEKGIKSERDEGNNIC